MSLMDEILGSLNSDTLSSLHSDQTSNNPFKSSTDNGSENCKRLPLHNIDEDIIDFVDIDNQHIDNHSVNDDHIACNDIEEINYNINTSQHSLDKVYIENHITHDSLTDINIHIDDDGSVTEMEQHRKPSTDNCNGDPNSFLSNMFLDIHIDNDLG